MGNAFSKAVRRLPKRTEPSAWVGATTPSSGQRPLPGKGASDVKTEAIERDAHDPHFLAKLNQLGPVRVDHHMQAVRLTSDANNLFRSREQSEHEAFKLQLPRNHLHSIALSNLLDERKSATSQTELQDLAERYGVDVWKVENLARFVNSPSVQGGKATRTVNKGGEENITMTAVWIDHNVR